jgi:threonine/homoserine/homoserine lactone efflux protein
MTETAEPPAARKWAIRAFLILFIASAAWMAWFGVQQQRLHGAKTDGQPKNPYEDRSLFGR